ncbi:MAG: leucine-rich repeat protein, partial [Clostridia bacterium]|nr:leucine-rich repeat protein [Clostridia bacterium]
MYKCKNCGQEFEGKFCPNCGAGVSEHKTCPSCGAILASNAKFCNQCGFSFNSNAPANTGVGTAAAVKKPNILTNALAWIKAHLKIVVPSAVVLFVAIIMLSLIPTFILASKNGSYFSYNAYRDEVDTKRSITLSTGKWTGEDGEGGTYKVNGNTVTLYAELFGEKMEFLSATVKNGVMKYDEHGSEVVYVTKSHKHKYGDWYDKDKLTCTKAQTHARKCDCNREDVEVVTEAPGHKGEWTVTKEATCVDYGERETHCNVCNEDVTEYPEPLGHNYVSILDFKTHKTACLNCNEITEEKEHSNSNCSVCRELKSITIADGVTSIGDRSFKECVKLTSVTIPDSVTSIGGSAFYGCSGLTSITIPDSV